MKLGLFAMPYHPESRPLAEAYEADQERVVYADELGYEEAFIGEHHSCAVEPVASSLVLLAGVIARTKNIKLGSGVLPMPMYHPLAVAATVAQFDHMSRGRFIMGVGPGGLASDIEGFDRLDGQERNERLAESVDIVHQLWANDAPHRVKTKHYDFAIDKTVNREFAVGDIIKPYQKPYPPIASTAMSPFSSSVTQAVLKGWGVMSANFTPISTVFSHWTKVVEGFEKLGQAPTGANWRVARNVVVAGSDQEALDRVMDPQGPNFSYFDYQWRLFSAVGYGPLLNDTGRPDSEVSVEDVIRNCVIHGSAETVAEKLNEIREKAPFGTMLLAALDAGNETYEAQERETMRRLALEVVPKLAVPAHAGTE